MIAVCGRKKGIDCWNELGRKIIPQTTASTDRSSEGEFEEAVCEFKRCRMTDNSRNSSSQNRKITWDLIGHKNKNSEKEENISLTGNIFKQSSLIKLQKYN